MGANFSSEPVVEKHTERDQNDTFTVAVSSCQGWRMSQEDEHSLWLELPGEHKASFFAVFDGHGSGRVSKHASESLWRHITQNELYVKGNFREALEQSFLSFDREVNASYNAQLAGTTAICVLIVDNVIYCANIGDSRAVASINCECQPLSQDHKPDNPGELKRIIAAGGYVLGNRVNGNLALSRAFGDFHYKSNDQLPAEQQIVCPCPDIKRIELNDDVDFIVLACDGIWDVLSSEEVVNFIIARLERNVEPGLICEQLTTRCIATDYELVIGCDNMTVLLICHTRGRSWEDYCTDIFEKRTKSLGLTTRTRTFDDNFDNTFQQHDDRFLRSASSTEYSRDTSLDRTFALANETSTDSDNTSSEMLKPKANDSFTEIMSLIFDRNLPEVAGAGTSASSDETPPITDIVAEEQPSEVPVRVDRTTNENADQSEGSSLSEMTNSQNEITPQQSEQTTSDSNKLDLSADMSMQDNVKAGETDADDTRSCETTEIHLSTPDEDDENSTEPNAEESEDALKLQSEADLIQDGSHNTIEIQLGSPDEQEIIDDVAEEEVQELRQDDLPEVVKDLESEPAASEEQAANESTTDDNSVESKDGDE